MILILSYYPYRISCLSRCTVVTRKTLTIKHTNKTKQNKTGEFFKLKCSLTSIYILDLISRSTRLIKGQFLSIRHPIHACKVMWEAPFFLEGLTVLTSSSVRYSYWRTKYFVCRLSECLLLELFCCFDFFVSTLVHSPFALYFLSIQIFLVLHAAPVRELK